MGTSDGSVLGLTKILDNGPDNQRFNIVLVAEGFQDTMADRTAFNTRCQDVVDAFLDEPWFGAGLLAAINIHRLNVGSTDQGADNPATCADMSTATAVTAATYFDATYCTSGLRRCLGVNWSLVRTEITSRLPTWHAAVVIVNSTMRGGCASGNVFATAVSTDFINVVMHELGHAAFGLADEYSTWQGCTSGETDRDNAPPGEPMKRNITAASTLGSLKWAHLVDPMTPVPTMQNPDCTKCDLRPNVRADDTEIGLFEGAGYYHCGYFRPAYTCRMRNSGTHYCRVCAESIRTKLASFIGTAPALAASVVELDFGNVGAGSTVTMSFDLANVGTAAVTGITLSAPGSGFVAAPVTVGTLAAGQLRRVDVTFGPILMMGPRTATLVVTSSATALSLPLRATVCTAAPLLEVVTAGGGLTLNFGDVGRRLTMYRWFEVRNRRSGCTAQMNVTLPTPPAGFAYAAGTPLSFSLAAPAPGQAYTDRRVYVAFSSPATGGPDFLGSLTVSTTGITPASTATLTLRARAVDPPPVDSVLVIDRSGSMSEPTGVPGASKSDLAIQAANLYVSLLKDNDRIGIVRFNHEARNPQDILQALAVAGDPVSGAGRIAARAALTPANLAPSGATSIGGGTILGSTVLDAAVATARAVVVLTDGIQNSTPDIPTATAAVAAKTPRQRVFAVGLGLNQLEDTLSRLASVTNGAAQITGELAGDREFLLQKLYVQILSDVGDEAFVQDPVEVIYPGISRATDIWIGEVDVAADFIVAFRRASAYPALQTWLEAPDGAVIEPGDAGGTFPNVQFVVGDGHYYFRVQFPAFPARPDAHIGRWRIWLSAAKPGRQVTYSSNNTAAAGSGSGGIFVYSAMAKARSDLRLGGFVAQASSAPGSTMTVVLEPTLYGAPVGLDEPVEVTIARPDGVERTLRLSADASGQYRGDFADTWLLGAYQVTAEVSATTPLGNRVTRYRSLTGLIYLPGRGGGDGDGEGHDGGDKPDGDDCRRATLLLDRLDKLLGAGREIDEATRKEISAIVDTLRGFILDCCGCAPVAASRTLSDALSRARELLEVLESSTRPR